MGNLDDLFLQSPDEMTEEQLAVLSWFEEQIQMTHDEYVKAKCAELEEMTDEQLLKEYKDVQVLVDSILNQETREALLEGAGNLEFFMQIAESIKKIAKGRRLVLPLWNGWERIHALFGRGKNVLTFPVK